MENYLCELWDMLSMGSISVVENVLRPLKRFGRTHQRNPGLIQNHRPLLWGDQWAHPDALARLTEDILGPYEIIGHFYGEINGPTQMLWQDTPKKSWDHMKSSATSVERSMDPLRWFGRTHWRNSGPVQNHRPFLWGDQWAHLDASAMAVGRCSIIDTCASMGPFRIIGDIIWQWLWAHSEISTPLLWWAHSGLLTLWFGSCYGPIQEYWHLCFGGPIQDYCHCHSAIAVGWFGYIDIVASVGPFKFIGNSIQQWLWAHPRILSSLFWWAHS